MICVLGGLEVSELSTELSVSVDVFNGDGDLEENLTFGGKYGGNEFPAVGSKEGDSCNMG